ncbi:hypothetical protein ACIA8C_35425 [Nocardia sp. NPDC051321]|uniref:hypothetical protein n=1 Tax=Nocardia sp. NPDC051321 TaxID=3364323 RepID=UPI0037BB269F
MQDAQTPQQALDIAAAATRQARAAAALPRWLPPVTGLLAGITIVMLCTAIDDGGDTVLTWIAGILGIASGVVYYKLAQSVRGFRHARGVIPLPLAWWKQEVVMLLAIFAIPTESLSYSGWGLWLRILPGVIVAGWIWYEQGRPWKSRPRTGSWEN